MQKTVPEAFALCVDSAATDAVPIETSEFIMLRKVVQNVLSARELL